ncbi:MAG: hypothetical protein Q9174_005420, partial [Haloplaca sp. 1 TL-2023]
MLFSKSSLATAGLWALVLSTSAATPMFDQATTVEKRNRDFTSLEELPDSIGTDLTLCYEAGFVTCTAKRNLSLNECFNGKKLEGAGWTGFTNDKISSFAITGQTPAKCKLYKDETCQVPIIEESSANGKVIEPNIDL